MIKEPDTLKMIFGLKVKYHRGEQGLSYQQLADRTGLSTSYLHDIEKGRRYPKGDKIVALAVALGLEYDYMVSTKAVKRIQPVIDLLTSDFLAELPLDFFGIGADRLFELFSNAPEKVNAFISTIFKITRNYQLQREHLYLTALRSYQDMFDNYFPDLESAVARFKKELRVRPEAPPYAPDHLTDLLEKHYDIAVDRTTLAAYPELDAKRSYFSEKKRLLFLNRALSPAQEAFLLGRELAFQYLKLSPRPYLTRLSEAHSFEELLNNFKASYFSVALLMPAENFQTDIQQFAARESWAPEAFLHLLEKYQVTPEMLLQRLTNILPGRMGIKDLFFIRLESDSRLSHYRMTKELHLSQLHNPYANQLNEHYCRRWVSVNIIKRLRSDLRANQVLADAQVSAYWETTNSYLCISLAKSGTSPSAKPASVTIGLLVNDNLRQLFRFLKAANLPQRTVNTTCERCSIRDCEARAVPPVVIEQAHRSQRESEILQEIEKR